MGDVQLGLDDEIPFHDLSLFGQTVGVRWLWLALALAMAIRDLRNVTATATAIATATATATAAWSTWAEPSVGSVWQQSTRSG